MGFPIEGLARLRPKDRNRKSDRKSGPLPAGSGKGGDVGVIVLMHCCWGDGEDVRLQRWPITLHGSIVALSGNARLVFYVHIHIL